LRFASAGLGVSALVIGLPALVGFVGIAVGELIGRWLFYVTVVPLNMPGAFWRGAADRSRK
jgi:hypothetical protein